MEASYKMFMRDLPATLLRRWYLTLIGVLSTAGLCLAALTAFPPTYEAKANIVLLPPASTVKIGGNPYLQLSDLKQVVDVMIRALNSQDAVAVAATATPEGTYEVLPDYATTGPILVITADNQTPESTLDTLKVVTDLVGPTLVNLQSSLDIAPNSQITSSVLTTDGEPKTVRKGQIRALIVAVGIGLVGSAMIIALIDSLLLRRSARRRPLAEAEPTLRAGSPAGPSLNGRSAAELATPRSRRIGLNSPASSSQEIVVGEAHPTDDRRLR